MKNNQIKRTVLLILGFCIMLIIAISPNALAQENGTGLSVGIKTGIASGTFTSQSYVEVSSAKNGFHFGIFADYPVIEIMTVSVELLYTRTGAVDMDPQYFYSDENALFDDKIVNSSITSNIVNIPIMASFIIPGITGQIKPRIYIGGDFGYYLSSESLNTYEVSSGTSTVYLKYDESMRDRLLNFDYGLIAGTGFNIYGDTFNYQFDIRYRMGLKNLNNTNSDFVNSAIYQNVLSFMFGIAYNL